MTEVGYSRMTILPFDKSFVALPSGKIVIEGKTNEGATSTFEITGLSKEALKVYGSNIPYLVLQKGTGDVKVNFGILDLPFAKENIILGRTASANKVVHIGEATEAPYCAVLLESSNLQGNKIGFGLYYGKFARDAISAETLTDSDFTPSPTDFTFVPIPKKFEGINQTVGIAGESTAFAALEKELFDPIDKP